ncbi:putative leucine-rich repeat receptor-like serine/threonine-protein kinase At2g19230 [Lactuca sativa]|uniref:putative leucine-rich repeat receptor-like serine/threonine-protein kinase At2g19230 n=1 Tax=Lactuca sativa TaxID=4236 RepID=UPI000CD8D3A9|nr:putative leucine-rich repeat receptor-like serine/threonine-protein kinase At2g19230 [Lactuca sativa]
MATHFILFSVLLLSQLALSVSGQVFWSVNCGESVIYTDSNLMVWMPDATLISNGFARVVQSSNSISTVLDSLRVFTTRKKNCYSTPVTKGEKVLVRASFNYGNYDRLSSPPTFDLHFDGNFWTTVETTNSGLQMYEATYVTKGDTVSVCVAQTKSGQFPFMSALEVRSVNSDVYSEVDVDRALFLINRFSYGASGIIRFPQDPYDRIWRPALGGTKAKTVTNDAILIDPTGANDPPSGIFENAITVNSTSDSLYLGTISPLNTPVSMTMYFSEVSNLNLTGQMRSFRFYETTSSSSSSISDPISPPYRTMIVRYLYNYTVDSITDISLIATTNSDLPPIINAIETFNISEVLTEGTDSNDVAALALLQTTFDVLGEWSGDPCLPAPYSWDWLKCSNETPPRITSLYLNGYELSGELPDISSMDALEIIDLHNNTLDGEIPRFLGTMTNLQQLNLANNEFSGPIPTSLSDNNKLKLTVTGNPSVCTSGKSCSTSPGTVNSSPGTVSSSPGSTSISRSKKKKKSSSLPAVLGTSIPTFFLIWIAVGVFVILRKKRKAVKDTNKTAATAGGVNENSNWMHKIGEEMMNGVPQTFGSSPSPLLDDSGKSSDVNGQTGAQNHDQP